MKTIKLIPTVGRKQNSSIALRHAHRATVLENGIDVLEGSGPKLRSRADIKALYLGERSALTV
jgi:branched-chain amino acid transport system ATP-binding protein